MGHHPLLDRLCTRYIFWPHLDPRFLFDSPDCSSNAYDHYVRIASKELSVLPHHWSRTQKIHRLAISYRCSSRTVLHISSVLLRFTRLYRRLHVSKESLADERGARRNRSVHHLSEPRNSTPYDFAQNECPCRIEASAPLRKTPHKGVFFFNH